MIVEKELTVKELLSRLEKPCIIEFREANNELLATSYTDSKAMSLFEDLYVKDWFVTNDTDKGIIIVTLWWNC